MFITALCFLFLLKPRLLKNRRQYLQSTSFHRFLSPYLILYSWTFGFQCVFGGAGCSHWPGGLAFLFISSYIMKVCGSALLLRYSEGATLLAIVHVLVRVLYSCYFRLAITQYILVRVLHLEQSTWF